MNQNITKAYNQIIKSLISEKAETSKDLERIKRKITKETKCGYPRNISLLKTYRNLLKNRKIKKSEFLEVLLKKRRIRGLSGIVTVSVLTKTYPCPGKCIFCPKEKGLPQSYLSGEPAVERAKKLSFDPYTQTKRRIESLEEQGHPVDKIEIRIIGASFSAYPKKYRSWFFANIFAASNKRRFIEEKEFELKDLEKEQKLNENKKQRIVGISIETRPDLITKKEILFMRNLGITMVELGVQTIFNDILKKNHRGHGVKETISATKSLKDHGFKIMYQIMPNLLGSTIKKDFECFKTIFQDSRFKPDWLKIYPCLVCKGTKLYEIWKKGLYKSYSDKELVNLLIKAKLILPYWNRLARLFRDIPAQKIETGSKISNLREIIQKEMRKRNLECKCMRCREVKERYDPKEKIYLFREDYNASGREEIFLSFENKNRTKLFAFLRLRINQENTTNIMSVLKNTSIVRELHTYGQVIPIHKNTGSMISPQHKGLGKKLVKKAEEITKEEFNMRKIAIISGIGAREYYRKKLGYNLEQTYMTKELDLF